MRVMVTRRDIEQGIRGEASTCPVARAIARQMPRTAFVTVLPLDALVTDFIASRGVDTWRRFVFPEKARQFVVDFDAGKPVKPFAFETVEEVSA